jgi:NAD-dependent deacetylase
MAADTVDLAEVGRWLRSASSARATTVLTGAGVSTDSGIPDFRGPAGVWTTNPRAERLSTLSDYLSDPDVRVEAWRQRQRHPAWTAQPNAAHRALAALESAGVVRTLVTQNIDGLHQRAGSQNVIELHGTVWWAVCLDCEVRTPMADVLARVEAGEADPRCLECAGIQKSATISFGQSLDRAVLEQAARSAASCDVLLAVGSSLQVHPAAGLCDVAVAAGAKLVIVNAQPTPYDADAAAVVRLPIGDALPRLAEWSGSPIPEPPDAREAP